MSCTKTMFLRVRAIMAFSISGLLWGCAAAEPAPEDADDFPSFEEFRASVAQDSEGRFVVDGDIAILSEGGLRDFYEVARAAHEDELAALEGEGVARSALLVNQIGSSDDLQTRPDRFDITYCVSSAFGARYDTVVDELDAATRSWSDIIGVRYRFVDSSSCTTSTDVDFDVRPAPSDATYNAVSFFPGDPRSARELLIADVAFTTTAGGRDFQGILRHELGHTLGFRHEHIVLVPQCTGEAATDYRAVTEYDVDSIMHYPQCRPSGTGGYRQSYLDYKGGNLLYGMAPSLVEATAF